ncbi:MAG TPA: hypothetical protein VFH88_05970, partial [Candidatus Krumholzibacteria bacterium]|nr:hypothetical protein [Candidatus Krumholzibacteria bacterium]
YGGGQGGGDQDREQIRQRLHNLGAPDRLVIAENDHDIMLIANSADTLDVVPDGKEHARKTPRGLTVTTQAQWNELALQVTTRGEGGREMTRVYRINSDGRLEVVTQLPARDGAEAMQIVLRYDDASAKN